MAILTIRYPSSKLEDVTQLVRLACDDLLDSRTTPEEFSDAGEGNEHGGDKCR
jgi:hypothetical protein